MSELKVIDASDNVVDGCIEVEVTPARAISSCEAVMLPEFSPLKVIEYFACGIPVVATKKGELSRIIRDGQSGILIPEDDCESLFGAILRLYSDTSLRKSMAKKGQELIKGRTWVDNARKITEFARMSLSGGRDEKKE